jgi:hypothetical protein
MLKAYLIKIAEKAGDIKLNLGIFNFKQEKTCCVMENNLNL